MRVQPAVCALCARIRSLRRGKRFSTLLADTPVTGIQFKEGFEEMERGKSIISLKPVAGAYVACINDQDHLGADSDRRPRRSMRSMIH